MQKQRESQLYKIILTAEPTHPSDTTSILPESETAAGMSTVLPQIVYYQEEPLHRLKKCADTRSLVYWFVQ